MVGIVFAHTFKLFQLIELGWQRAGVNATLLMQTPLQSNSLSEFWGKRWNTGFGIPARKYLLAPLAGRIGVAGATGFAATYLWAACS
jgi:D-alanyl-lipoteichoic acid acyltransferase DltB (MBOAT superfamily)